VRIELKGYIPAETTQTLKPGDDVALPIELKAIPAAPPPVTTASIAIDSTPEGANVFVDGVQVGVTPYTHQVELGSNKRQSFKVRVELDGYVTAQTSATVKGGDSISVPFALKSVPVHSNDASNVSRHVRQLSLLKVSTLANSVPVDSIRFSPDAKRIAVSGLDSSLTIYSTNGGSPKKVEASPNTIVRITPDWKKILLMNLHQEDQTMELSVQTKDANTFAGIGSPFRIRLHDHTRLEHVYVGDGRIVLCGSIGENDPLTGFITIADFSTGDVKTITGGYRITSPASSADDSTYAAYVEPLDLRSTGSVIVIPADLTKANSSIPTDSFNSAAEIELSEDGNIIAVTGQKIRTSGVQILGTNLYDSASGAITKNLPAIRVAALIGHGSRLLGWRTQIGGPIVELLDAKTGDGLGETPGSEVWLSHDEKLAAEAGPDGTITVYKLNQP